MSKQPKDQKVTKEESIYKKFPEPVLNNTTVKYLDHPNESTKVQPISVYPSEVIFQGFICSYQTI